MRGRGGRHAILLVGETESFRKLARSQVLPTDTVLEIGCSYGEATALIATRARCVIAVDISSDALERAAERCAGCTNVRFEQIDCVKQPARLLEVAGPEGVHALFLDINGNRASEVVTSLLAALQERFRPAVTVVKNRELYLAARDLQQIGDCGADASCAQTTGAGTVTDTSGAAGGLQLLPESDQDRPAGLSASGEKNGDSSSASSAAACMAHSDEFWAAAYGSSGDERMVGHRERAWRTVRGLPLLPALHK